MEKTTSTWRQIQRLNFTNWKDLLTFLELSEEQFKDVLPNSPFPLNLPRRLAEKIEKGNTTDPILKQFIPTKKETEKSPAFKEQPVEDFKFQKANKLLHKYNGRVLLVCTSACAMHCRYCFRQNYDYLTQDKLFEEELKIIASDSSIEEVILSGGDPLSLSNQVLKNLVSNLEAIPHLKRLRFHSRFPIGIPERLDDEFLSILENSRFQIFFVIHCNHPKELDLDVQAHLKKVQKLGIPVLNQAVLLSGVNDTEETQIELCQLLINSGILPYYLHQLDKVQGSMHFEADIDKGRSIIKGIRENLSGYAVPRFVQEIPGEKSKTPISL